MLFTEHFPHNLCEASTLKRLDFYMATDPYSTHASRKLKGTQRLQTTKQLGTVGIFRQTASLQTHLISGTCEEQQEPETRRVKQPSSPKD